MIGERQAITLRAAQFELDQIKFIWRTRSHLPVWSALFSFQLSIYICFKDLRTRCVSQRVWITLFPHLYARSSVGSPWSSALEAHMDETCVTQCVESHRSEGFAEFTAFQQTRWLLNSQIVWLKWEFYSMHSTNATFRQRKLQILTTL